MKKAVLAAAAVFACVAHAADNGEGHRLTALERKAKLEAVVNERAGGFIEKPGSGRGSIVYVNCQTNAPKAWIEESIAYFKEMTKFNIVYEEGAFDLREPKFSGNVAIFVVEDESLPVMLVAPEGRWAMVNIAVLAQEKRPMFFEQRTKKELSRAFAYLCGATASQYDRSLTRGLRNLSELDKNRDYELPMDIINRFWGYMKPLGVVPAERATYLKACQDGWAPQPTNEYQQAIWDKVHAMPEKPMKIEFDPKNGR